jgi:hypothetical protein
MKLGPKAWNFAYNMYFAFDIPFFTPEGASYFKN